MLGLTPPQATFFAILIAAFVLLISERIRTDLVAVLIIVALSATGILTPEESLAGFSSEPAIVIVAVFVLSGALDATGVSETLGRWIGKLAGRTYSQAVAVIMPAVALLSAFIHHVATTAIMLPVTLNLSRERDIAPSKLLMPLSFAASLGTTISIIGAPAFLIASDALRRAGHPALGVLSIAPIGLTLSLVGTLFVLLIGRFLLPAREGSGDLLKRFELTDYATELKVLPDSLLIGKTIDEISEDRRFDFEVIGLVRRGRRLRGSLGAREVKEGDVLMIRATSQDLVNIWQEAGIELEAVGRFTEDAAVNPVRGDDEVSDRLVQVVIAPRAEIAGRTLKQIGFRRRYGAVVVGLWRQDGLIRQELSRIRLRAGDVLVLHGDEGALSRVENDPSFLMMVPFQGESHRRGKGWIAILIMVGAVLMAAFNLMPLELATLAGAALVVLTGCITPRQAYRAIDARIFVFIAGAIPLGVAMEKTGASALAAYWLQQTVGGWPQPAILAAIFAAVALITQLMSDAATTALFAPVVVALAQALGQAPEPYVVTVAMAAVASFLTPIGHHGNLLIYGPGGYRFVDFVVVGGALTLLVALVVVVLAPMLWG